MTALVDSEWLENNIARDDLAVLDASMPVVGAGPSGAEPLRCIPGALRFDIESFSDPDSGLPHTLLSPEAFETKVRELGIRQDTTIVVYDDQGIYSAPRAWWNFKLMGMKTVHVLDGGLTAWTGGGRAVADQHSVTKMPGDFVARLNTAMLASRKEVMAASNSADTRIVDLRSAARFQGLEDEPRPGLRRGQIPSSVNIPFPHFLNGGFMKPVSDLEEIFRHACCRKDQRLIFACGSGVTACIGVLAAYVCQFRSLALYDGSWAEWGKVGAA